MIVKTEKSGFNISFRNFAAISTEGKVGLQKVHYQWWLKSQCQEDKKGDREIQQLQQQDPPRAFSTNLKNRQTIQFLIEHVLRGRHWGCGVTGISRAILQNAEYYFQTWSFSCHYSVKEIERRNKESKEVHNKSYFTSLCQISRSKQCSQLKNSSPFLLKLPVFKLPTSYQSQTFKRKEKKK